MLQTPTPHPNAWVLPRACRSRPCRGPLDAHFQPQQALKRSASLPAGMDSCARKARSKPRGRFNRATSHNLETPAFTGLDPRPVKGKAQAAQELPSDIGPTSADFGILHKAAPSSSSSGQPSAPTTSSIRTTPSLTPRLAAFSMAAVATAAGCIDSTLGANADTTLQCNARTQPANAITDTDVQMSQDNVDNISSVGAGGMAHSMDESVTTVATGALGRRRRKPQSDSAPAGTSVCTRARARAERPFRSPDCSQAPGTFSPSLQRAPLKPQAAEGNGSLRAGSLAEHAASTQAQHGAWGATYAGGGQLQVSKVGAGPGGHSGYKVGTDESDMAIDNEASCSRAPQSKRAKRMALAHRNVNALRGGIAIGQQRGGEHGKPESVAARGFGLGSSFSQ